MIRKKAKGCLTAIAVFLGICFVVGIFSNDEDKNQNINNFSSNQEVFTTEVDGTTTKILIAQEITTAVLTTEEPTTAVPITEEPTTAVPITEEPTTAVPITKESTTIIPIVEEPTTAIPITEEPITTVLTTEDNFLDNKYDDLQEIFSGMSLDMEIGDINNLKAGKNVILHANVSKNGDKLEYCLAYDPDVASGKRGASGDYIEISFSSKDGSFMFAKYVTGGYSALLYNYGIYFDFMEKETDNKYSGYYCFRVPEATGYLMEYDNGNSKEIPHCIRCDSIVDALALIIKNQK